MYEPWFEVKDHGTGLSHSGIKSLFCMYFGSNKTKSNRFIGALGLGSKSPFCYVKDEGFTVTARYNGRTRVYTMSKDKGKPKWVLSYTAKTPGVKPGLEVKMPVRQSDIWEFENKAKIALEFFEPAPSLNINIEILRPNYSVKTERWGMRVDPDTPRAARSAPCRATSSIRLGRLTSPA